MGCSFSYTRVHVAEEPACMEPEPLRRSEPIDIHMDRWFLRDLKDYGDQLTAPRDEIMTQYVESRFKFKNAEHGHFWFQENFVKSPLETALEPTVNDANVEFVGGLQVGGMGSTTAPR